MKKLMNYAGIFLVLFTIMAACIRSTPADVPVDSLRGNNRSWVQRPRNAWPQITMVNHIEYTDSVHPEAGCGFLLDTGFDTVAVTAKHILTYFNSDNMESIAFGSLLAEWKMTPKNNPADQIIIDKLINENPLESIDDIPPALDWLLFTIGKNSPNIQPLQFRPTPLEAGEKVFIIGWRYCDRHCSQRIYEGKVVSYQPGTVKISTKLLSRNKIPGLSGSPVIDSKGYLIGIMSRKHGELELLSSIEYPRKVLSVNDPTR